MYIRIPRLIEAYKTFELFPHEFDDEELEDESGNGEDIMGIIVYFIFNQSLIKQFA